MHKKIDFSKFTLWELYQIPAGDADPLKGYIIDITCEYAPVVFLLNDADGKGLITRGDIIGVKGKAKQGKTYACACMEAAVLKGQYMGFTTTKPDFVVLHIDTEQNARNVMEKAKIVYTLCEWDPKENNKRYIPITLRECTVKERISKTKAAIERYKPDLVFIDGIRDLCQDFNDISESTNLINSLMKLSSSNDCAIICVLHENKADGNMRGHLGTELLNKCSETYQITKKDGVITVEQTECRNAPIGKWSFCIDDNGIPQSVQMANISKTDEKQEKMKAIFTSIFSRKNQYSHKDLTQECMEALGCENRTARNRIADAVDLGIISKPEKGIYTLTDFSTYDDEEDLL